VHKVAKVVNHELHICLNFSPLDQIILPFFKHSQHLMSLQLIHTVTRLKYARLKLVKVRGITKMALYLIVLLNVLE